MSKLNVWSLKFQLWSGMVDIMFPSPPAATQVPLVPTNAPWFIVHAQVNGRSGSEFSQQGEVMQSAHGALSTFVHSTGSQFSHHPR
jgi:hypothetical protein